MQLLLRLPEAIAGCEIPMRSCKNMTRDFPVRHRVPDHAELIEKSPFPTCSGGHTAIAVLGMIVTRFLDWPSGQKEETPDHAESRVRKVNPHLTRRPIRAPDSA